MLDKKVIAQRALRCKKRACAVEPTSHCPAVPNTLLTYGLSLGLSLKMANVAEQRLALKFMQKEGETATKAYSHLHVVYGEKCMSRTRAFEWFKRYKHGRTSTDNDM